MIEAIAFSLNEIEYSDPIIDLAKDYLDSPEEGLTELRRIYDNENKLRVINLFCISAGAVYFGDPEFTMDVMEKGVRIEASGLWQIWLPVMKDVRQTPRFKALVKKIGLFDYWNKSGWPDICQPTDDSDFECD